MNSKARNKPTGRVAPMEDQIKRVREHTLRHPELRQAHHFLFDLRLSTAGTEYIVMGVNPGETNADYDIPGPTEETSLYDFHKPSDRGSSSSRWLKNISFFLETDRVTLAEYFFWSSSNTGLKFTERFGPLKRSPHLVFCRDLNWELIAYHDPVAIISPGLGMAKLASTLYDLDYKETEVADNGHKLVLHYSDGIRPWLFTKHWSGAYGFLASSEKNKGLYRAAHSSFFVTCNQ